MNYELAKELKDAGFQQEGDGVLIGNVGLIKPEDVRPDGIVRMAQEDFYYIPTLSELIEACGEEFHALVRIIGNMWSANGYRGDSPEEAVARLWLALNKK